DVVSGGEISRCLAAGVDPSKIIFSGCGKFDSVRATQFLNYWQFLGKSLEEIDLAVKSDVQCINVESWDELDRIESVANKYNKVQSISIRINPELNLDGE